VLFEVLRVLPFSILIGVGWRWLALVRLGLPRVALDCLGLPWIASFSLGLSQLPRVCHLGEFFRCVREI